MKIRQIEVFLAVAETGGVRRAANRLCITQSAVAKAISQLEAELGCPLFDRSALGLRLNEIQELAKDIIFGQLRLVIATMDIEEINTELKAAGANFHLNPDGGVAGWTDAEMGEGFIPAEEKPKEARRTLDMRRRMEFAGTEQIQWIPGGRFAVSYDEDGYAKSAVRLHD